MDSLLKLLAQRTGLSPKDILHIAITAPKRYKVYDIAKRKGGVRTIAQPSREVKALQRILVNSVLAEFPVHPLATGYREGKNIRDNAEIHRRSDVIMKLDFCDFFPSITVGDWVALLKKRTPAWHTPTATGLTKSLFFWGNGTSRPVQLSIGAPSSPLISNIIMYDLDVAISTVVAEGGASYSRYADDITISAASTDQLFSVEREIRATVGRNRSPRLRFNERKRGVYARGQRRMVTGLIITPDRKISIGRARKREISSLVHRYRTEQLNAEEVARLKGLLGFAIATEPQLLERLRQKYGDKIVDRVLSTHIPLKRPR